MRLSGPTGRDASRTARCHDRVVNLARPAGSHSCFSRLALNLARQCVQLIGEIARLAFAQVRGSGVECKGEGLRDSAFRGFCIRFSRRQSVIMCAAHVHAAQCTRLGAPPSKCRLPFDPPRTLSVKLANLRQDSLINNEP